LTSRALNSSLYEKLLPIERFQVAIDAVGRRDHDELRRLTDSCPEHRYWAMDVNYGERLKAATVIALSAANLLLRARLALEPPWAARDGLEEGATALAEFSATFSVDESSLVSDDWNELQREIEATYCARASDLIGVCEGIRRFCEAIGVVPSNLLAFDRASIPLWELGQKLENTQPVNEEMAEVVHRYLTDFWSAMISERLDPREGAPDPDPVQS
jgi:hypothetical protein